MDNLQPAGDSPPPLPEPATSRLEMRDTEVGSVFVSNYPPYSQWTAEQVARYEQVLEARPGDEAPALGLYLHVPFCRKRCKFCYFRVYTDKNADEVGRYCDALADEIALLADRPGIAGRPLRFVYFGGGTPSYIAAKHLRQLVDGIRRVLSWEDAEEITFECEPGTLSRPKLETIRELGITRLSLGVESFDDRILEINGRAHVSKEIDRVLPWIAALEFDQLNIDLIAGMAGETWDTWRHSVQRTIDAAPDSVTIYQMELPFNTRFSRQVMEGGLEVPLADWQQKREWHGYALDRLTDAGYEISSAYTMVRSDRKCRFAYRDSLWHGADMLGTGVSSFGHVGGVHAQNTANWADYLRAIDAGRLPLHRALVTSPEDRLIRELVLQLKTGRIETAYFRDKFDVEITAQFATALGELADQRMLVFDAQRVELTRQGLLQVDSLLPAFYAQRYRNARYT